MYLTLEVIKQIEKDKLTDIYISGISNEPEVIHFVENLPLHIKSVFLNNDSLLYAIEKQLPIIDLCQINNYIKLSRSQYFVEISVNKSNMKFDMLKFVKDNKGKQMTVRLTGGEPTLHPDIDYFIKLLSDNEFHVVLVSNNTTQWVNRYDIHVEKGEQDDFYAIFDAPCDDIFYSDTNYSCGCSLPEDYGVCLIATDSYYPCRAGGIVDRLLYNSENSYQSLEDALKYKKYFFDLMCRKCGIFKYLGIGNKLAKPNRVTEEVYSRTYEFMRSK